MLKCFSSKKKKKAASRPAEEEEYKKEPSSPSFSMLGAFILVAVISTLLAIVGFSITSLLTTETVQTKKLDVQNELKQLFVSLSKRSLLLYRYKWTAFVGWTRSNKH